METELTIEMEEVENDFVGIMNQLNYIVTSADKESLAKRFKLEEITLTLGFSTKGKIAFIAEAGAGRPSK